MRQSKVRAESCRLLRFLRRRKRANDNKKQKQKPERAAHFSTDFFAVIALLF